MISSTDPVRILLVEDNDGDIDLVKEALSTFTTPHTLRVITDGASALVLLAGQSDDELPDLLLLDLNLPRRDGRQVLSQIKTQERTAHIPVIVLTSSNAERDRLQAYRLHANCFITKPSDIDAFFQVFSMIERFWLQLVELPRRERPRVPDSD